MTTVIGCVVHERRTVDSFVMSYMSNCRIYMYYIRIIPVSVSYIAQVLYIRSYYLCCTLYTYYVRIIDRTFVLRTFIDELSYMYNEYKCVKLNKHES